MRLQELCKRLGDYSAFSHGSVFRGVNDFNSKPLEIFAQDQVGGADAAIEEDGFDVLRHQALGQQIHRGDADSPGYKASQFNPVAHLGCDLKSAA